MRKKSILVKILSVWCFLKSTRPVYYQLHLNLYKTSIKHFLQKCIQKMHIYAFLTKKTWIGRHIFLKTANLLPIKLHIYRQKLISNSLALDQKK